nr:hypothetical protein [Tanacetum cinerariifolium]
EAEKEEFARRVEITKAELLGRHSQEEGAYWTKHYQMQLKTSHAASPPPAAPAAAPTSGSQATVLQSNATSQTKAGTSGARSVHPKQSATTSQKKGSKQEVETIDLCSSDDDILVE